jgi:acetyl/propionyl-CoA carboxylase alpha subunit
MKVLVANRSEIACRVFQACRELGLGTVAIVAPGDEQGRHVTYADQVVAVPSYLDIDAVVAAAQSSGAEIIHPGYGFLSERPAFVRALEKAQLKFAGPTAESMSAMGDKISSKELAAKIGVPTLPWARVPSGGDLKAAAKTVGFPLLLKATAGGGGKGMRRVNSERELDDAAESASAEAKSAFGDGTLFLERLVEKPRHIEVQVFGDGAGGGVHLHERECSLQRRHQKVWEEATAPHLSDAAKQGLHEAALKLVRAVKYRSAGTCEFLVDGQENFYFLEMNTRLQVEHPVTELVSGIDLVHAQLELAVSGRTLREVPSARGHALEVRLYAEDAAQDFLPTPGRIDRLRWPTGAGIRVDSGIEEGQVIGTSFDSMLGKLIVHAPTRALAVARLRYALAETVILGSGGLGTNQNYLRALLELPAVQEGRVHTGLLGSEFDYAALATPDADTLALVAAAREQGVSRASTSMSGVGAGASHRGADGARAWPSPWFAKGGVDG